MPGRGYPSPSGSSARLNFSGPARRDPASAKISRRRPRRPSRPAKIFRPYRSSAPDPGRPGKILQSIDLLCLQVCEQTPLIVLVRYKVDTCKVDGEWPSCLPLTYLPTKTVLWFLAFHTVGAPKIIVFWNWIEKNWIYFEISRFFVQIPFGLLLFFHVVRPK